MTPVQLADTPLAAIANATVRTALAAESVQRVSVEVDSARVSATFLERIPHEFAREHLILSQGQSGENVELLAVVLTTSAAVIHNTAVRLRRRVTPVQCDPECLARAIDEAYSHHETRAGEDVTGGVTSCNESEIDRLLAQVDRDLLSTEGKGPVIKLVDALIFDALGRSASDVHVQPLTDRTLIRYRLDGVLHTIREVPHALSTAVVNRIKVMGRMDITERRVPQDGRATVTIGRPRGDHAAADAGRAIDLRISTVPTSYGERAVIRLLDNTRQLCEFERLGMPQETADAFIERASQSHGMILVTGPTGSGKTTTLYATLRRIATPGVNVMTIEDPVEYELATTGLTISQCQVNPKKGVNFATGLRHILRQDPDIVMVGEIRDAETARIAIQSSLTGHMVFSTLHTNDAVSAITRLVDLGVEPYLISASLTAVLAQRLVRLAHQDCLGRGCDECLRTGFRGRTGIFELLAIDEAIRRLISAGAPLDELRGLARSALGSRPGMRTLREHGQELVVAGKTTQVEIDRVAAAMEEVPQ